MIAVMLVAVLGCAVSGPEPFLEPAEAWCLSEQFDRVHVVAPERQPQQFQLELSLNATGFDNFSSESFKFMHHFTNIIETMAEAGITGKVRFYFGGQMIGYCFPVFTKRVTRCVLGDDGDLDV